VLIAGLKLRWSSEAKAVQAYSDSQLVVSQLNGKCEVKDDNMAVHANNVQGATVCPSLFEIIHIP